MTSRQQIQHCSHLTSLHVCHVAISDCRKLKCVAWASFKMYCMGVLSCHNIHIRFCENSELLQQLKQEDRHTSNHTHTYTTSKNMQLLLRTLLVLGYKNTQQMGKIYAFLCVSWWLLMMELQGYTTKLKEDLI
jgi:hypothetical protein